MIWTVKIHSRVIKEIEFWQKAYIHRFERLIDELSAYGPQAKTMDVRRMKGRENMYRVRIGKNRVLYTVMPLERRIYVVQAGVRGGIYR